MCKEAIRNKRILYWLNKWILFDNKIHQLSIIKIKENWFKEKNLKFSFKLENKNMFNKKLWINYIKLSIWHSKSTLDKFF